MLSFPYLTTVNYNLLSARLSYWRIRLSRPPHAGRSNGEKKLQPQLSDKIRIHVSTNMDAFGVMNAYTEMWGKIGHLYCCKFWDRNFVPEINDSQGQTESGIAHTIFA
jgi:hypothetical protein